MLNESSYTDHKPNHAIAISSSQIDDFPALMISSDVLWNSVNDFPKETRTPNSEIVSYLMDSHSKGESGFHTDTSEDAPSTEDDNTTNQPSSQQIPTSAEQSSQNNQLVLPIRWQQQTDPAAFSFVRVPYLVQRTVFLNVPVLVNNPTPMLAMQSIPVGIQTMMTSYLVPNTVAQPPSVSVEFCTPLSQYTYALEPCSEPNCPYHNQMCQAPQSRERNRNTTAVEAEGDVENGSNTPRRNHNKRRPPRRLSQEFNTQRSEVTSSTDHLHEEEKVETRSEGVTTAISRMQNLTLSEETMEERIIYPEARTQHTRRSGRNRSFANYNFNNVARFGERGSRRRWRNHSYEENETGNRNSNTNNGE